MTDANEGPSRDPTEEDIEEAARVKEEAEFEKAADELEQLIQGIPELSQLEDSLLIDNTPDGYTREIIGLVARVITRLPNELSITGHTDATAFSDPSGYSNWELSADRALATRRVLEDFGVIEKRVAKVAG
jgi:chemotaxis protein MotB